MGEEIPPALRGLVEKALEKDPAERYQTMREMVVDLRRVARQKPEEAAPSATAPAPRRRIGWTVTLASALAAGLAGWFIHAGIAKRTVASSLRFIVAALKINTDLERMGDLSVNIAQSAQLLIDAPASPTVVDIPFIAGLAQSMVRKSIDAFVARDVALARDVLASDNAVDEFRTACYQQLIACMENDSATIKPALSLLGVIRTLERLADHATNIAEDVLFYVEGIDVRHNSGINDLRQGRS